MNVLHQAEERLSREHVLKASGLDFDYLEKKVLEIFNLKQDDLYQRTRQKTAVAARSLLCYWAVEEMKISQTDLAKRFALKQPAIAFAVSRGRDIAKEGGYSYANTL